MLRTIVHILDWVFEGIGIIFVVVAILIGITLWTSRTK